MCRASSSGKPFKLLQGAYCTLASLAAGDRHAALTEESSLQMA